MTIETLEKMLKPLEAPVANELLRWLYLHLPPQPISNKKMHRRYSEAIRILMQEYGDLDADSIAAVGRYLRTVMPLVEQYEKKEFRVGSATPEEVLKFLMEQHELSQYDLAKELGGQPVVSEILSGKRRLTREHIERLSKRFSITQTAFYPKDEFAAVRGTQKDSAVYSMVADKAIPARGYFSKRSKKRI